MYNKYISSNESLLKPPVSQKLKSGCVSLLQNECVGEHCTKGKEELLVILKGTATIQIEKEETVLTEHMVGFIPKGKMHNVCNKSDSFLEYMYIVTPVE
jgi:mannose-6-phosphate isomerase-like protein (cupin superfamily)